MIGVIGDSNTGKSTLLNALLGQKILPQSYKSSTSVIATTTIVDRSVPLLTFNRGSTGEILEGRKDILSRIKALNDEVRKSTVPAVVDLSIFCSACSSLMMGGIADGTLRLVDVPGVDETDNSIVIDCCDELLGMCHGLLVVVKHDGIKSDSLAVLCDRITRRAPHLFYIEGAITFVISQVDTIRVDDEEDGGDSDEERFLQQAIEDMKQELKMYLANRECFLLFRGFVQEVRVVAVSVDQRLHGGHEFLALVDVIKELHGRSHDLKMSREVNLSEDIYMTFCDMLLDSRPRFPHRATQVLGNAEHKKQMDTACLALSAASFIVTIPLGGWGVYAGCFLRLGAAATTLGISAAAGAAVAGDFIQPAADSGCVTAPAATLGGMSIVGGADLGAIGAEEAHKEVQFKASAQEIEDGVVYEDTLFGARGVPLYIGQFKQHLPEGVGRLFWPNTCYEAFIGDFDHGVPRQGVFFNERGCFVGRMRVADNGHLCPVELAESGDSISSLGQSAHVASDNPLNGTPSSSTRRDWAGWMACLERPGKYRQQCKQ